MRMALLAGCTAAAMILAGGALSQPAPAPASPPPEAATDAAPPPADAPAAAAPRMRRAGRASDTSKVRACRAEARRQGLSGQAASGQAAICLAEARLDCTRQAVAQKLGGGELRDFVRNCLGLPQRGRQPR